MCPRFFSHPYGQLLSMLRRAPSIHTSLLPSRDTNVTFCTTLHLTPSPVSALCNVDPQIAREIDTHTQAGKERYLVLQQYDEHAHDFPPGPMSSGGRSLLSTQFGTEEWGGVRPQNWTPGWMRWTPCVIKVDLRGSQSCEKGRINCIFYQWSRKAKEEVD